MDERVVLVMSAAYCYCRQHQAVQPAFTARWKQAQLQRKYDDQHESQPEVWHGRAEQGKYHTRCILPCILMYRSVNTERQGYHYSDEHGGSAQQQGIRKTLHGGLE